MKTFYLFTLIFFVTSIVYPQWSTDPYVNTRVSDWGVLPMAVEDGNRGAYINFVNPGYDPVHCYLQKINFNGTMSLVEPLRISNVNNGNYSATTGMFLTDDGSNELIVGYLSGIFYFDTTLGRFEYRLNPYVQRFDSNGNKIWGEEGVRIKKDTTKLEGTGILTIPDGNNGAICFWTFHTGGTAGGHLFLQRVSQNGELLWGDDGIMIADSVEFSNNMWMVSDDEGGVILQYIKWIQNQRHSYIQRYDSIGALIWTLDDRLYPRIIKDGEGGIIVGGTKYYDTLFVNRVSHNGEKLWGEDGIGIFVTQQSNIKPIINLNTDSTVTAFWSEYIYPIYNIYAQRLTLDGEKLWVDNFRISDTASSKVAESVIESEDNSNIFIWADSREGGGLFSQRIDKSGTKIWGDTDKVITYQAPSNVITVTDSNHGAIAVWSDDEPFNGILAQQISKNGNLGEIITSVIVDDPNIKPGSFYLAQNYPNPFNPITVINYAVQEAGLVKIKVYDILGCEVAKLVNETKEAGYHSVEFNASDLPSGIYFYKISTDKFTAVKKMILLR